MSRTFNIPQNCICTTNNELTEGREYILKEGSRSQVIVLEKVIENSDWLKLLCYIPDKEKTIELTHKNEDCVYYSMWRIFDMEEEHRLRPERKEFGEEKEMTLDEFLKDNPPKITKSGFLKSLTEEQIAQAVDHFKKIYDCRGWGDREKNLAYLAWLLGEEHLMLSDYFMFHEMGEVEFEAKDYEITFESDKVSGVCIQFTEGYYDLETLYREVLKTET